jgi:capsular polysaccharide export protein
LLWPWFRHYRHHRPLSPLEGLPWLRGVWRKLRYRFLERGRIGALSGPLSKRYFLVPLQIHTDAQVQVHSTFNSVPRFIREVMHSFAHHAPRKTSLVIKHHPLDRGYHDYSALIQREAHALGIASRVMYIHDQHLPTLLDHARGVVVINSTVGLSAVHHDAPTKVCGAAIYDMAGLTFSGSLDSFWRESAQVRVDRNLYRRFRGYLVTHTQLNGNFYRRLDVPGSYAGLTWIAQSGADQRSPGPLKGQRSLRGETMRAASGGAPAETAVTGIGLMGEADGTTGIAPPVDGGDAR